MITIIGIILAAILSLIGVGIAWVLRNVVRLGEDLAVVRQQLTPAGEPSLPVRVDDHEHRITIIETRLQLKEVVTQ